MMSTAKAATDIVHGGLSTLTLFVWVLGLLPISGATQNGTRAHAALAGIVKYVSQRVFLQASPDLRLSSKILEVSNLVAGWSTPLVTDRCAVQRVFPV